MADELQEVTEEPAEVALTRDDIEELVQHFDVADRVLARVLLLEATRIARVKEDLRERIESARAEREATGLAATSAATPNRELVAGDLTTGTFEHGIIGFYDDTKGTFSASTADELATLLLNNGHPELVTSITSKVVYEIDKKKLKEAVKNNPELREKLKAAGLATLVYNDKTWIQRHPSATEKTEGIEPSRYEVVRERD